MKQFRIGCLLAFICFCFCACPNEDGNHYIYFINKSEKNIACQEVWWGKITFSDTLFQCRIGAVEIKKDSLHRFPSCNNSGWETDFKAIPYIQLLVFDAETYYKYMQEPCDTIRKYVPILHRYQLKLEDLERMNWTVVYPPEE
jgi:hypothetical protein